MEEIARIINNVADVLNISKTAILASSTKESVFAREVLCYVTVSHFPAYIKHLSIVLGRSESAIEAYYNVIAYKIYKDEKLKNKIQKIQIKLDVEEKVIESQEELADYYSGNLNENQELTKRLFGFTYTTDDIARRKKAMLSSCIFMERNYK